jgi:hypothetical protein
MGRGTMIEMLEALWVESVMMPVRFWYRLGLLPDFVVFPDDDPDLPS